MSDTALVIQDAIHMHVCDSVAETTDSTLVIEDASHYHGADNVMLVRLGYTGSRIDDEDVDRSWRLL